MAVEGPSKAEITCKDNKDGTCTVSYLPTAPGDYNIIVKFDNKHIPGSPFTAKITGTKKIRYVLLWALKHRGFSPAICSTSTFILSLSVSRRRLPQDVPAERRHSSRRLTEDRRDRLELSDGQHQSTFRQRGALSTEETAQ